MTRKRDHSARGSLSKMIEIEDKLVGLALKEGRYDDLKHHADRVMMLIEIDLAPGQSSFGEYLEAGIEDPDPQVSDNVQDLRHKLMARSNEHLDRMIKRAYREQVKVTEYQKIEGIVPNIIL